MVVVVAIRLYQLQRISVCYRVTCSAYELHSRVTVRRHILQYTLVVVSRSSAALFNKDTNTWLKVKWLYCKCLADNVTHSVKASVTYINAIVTVERWDNGYEINRPTKDYSTAFQTVYQLLSSFQ